MDMSPKLRRVIKTILVIVVVLASIGGALSAYIYSFFTSPDLVANTIKYELPTGWEVCRSEGPFVEISSLACSVNEGWNGYLVLIPLRAMRAIGVSAFGNEEAQDTIIYYDEPSCSSIKQVLEKNADFQYECMDVVVNGMKGVKVNYYSDGSERDNASTGVVYTLSISTNWSWFSKLIFGDKVALEVRYFDDTGEPKNEIDISAFNSFVESMQPK